MTRLRKILLSLFISSILIIIGCGSDSSNDSLKVTILQTTDMHHHLKGVGHYYSDSLAEKGGLERISYKVNKIRDSVDNPVVLVDSGDFLMGSAYDMTNGQSPAIWLLCLI